MCNTSNYDRNTPPKSCTCSALLCILMVPLIFLNPGFAPGRSRWMVSEMLRQAWGAGFKPFRQCYSYRSRDYGVVGYGLVGQYSTATVVFAEACFFKVFITTCSLITTNISALPRNNIKNKTRYCSWFICFIYQYLSEWIRTSWPIQHFTMVTHIRGMSLNGIKDYQNIKICSNFLYFIWFTDRCWTVACSNNTITMLRDLNQSNETWKFYEKFKKIF